ncbi:3-deoxy-D-manno-octulosonic acid transferase [Pelagimonas phthalicica]|uniref:3-deoxy-D-manno-octulosonic acid transferase n=1 Tax=Pelagimonas phthalicica TaxID=1037362 RepID=A0A238J8E4_9RHOB|nr:glycosyltransferase N-terminal domain-containing protein [Pelagimonas phthalicica]TDS94480.1 3-deoxy-D-manno-octulosonic-acid transferase [Pelagimonas phthalicica]SMX26991.1 3-deoxy-D-manno-octulosonic acid transferase [Pelagimonas phthalicica]
MSRRALSLAAYLAYARGSAFAKPISLPDRPSGPVIWAYAEEHEQGRALGSLCARLLGIRPEISVFASGKIPVRPDLTHISLPAETVAECAQFASGLRPDIVLWTGRSLRPALLDELKKQGAYLIALDARDKLWQTPAPRWMPDPGPATLTLFDSFYTVDASANRRLRRLGVDRELLRKKGPLIDNDPPPPCDDQTHEELAQILSGRPVWLAANLQSDEAGDILRAHRMATRLAHRLLLIMVPASEDDYPRMKAEADELQMRICNWDLGETPDELTQVLITETPEELGLWYRLAPLVFLGGSLTAGHGGQDPFLAAALGAAILYGPNVGQHVDAYSRLVEAGAARIVRDADSLAAAVSHLVAPDQAAVMAHAGWDLVSSGAALVDAVLSEICAELDKEGEP